MTSNNKNKTLLITLIIFLLIAGGFIYFLTKPVLAPDVSLKTITNKTFELKNLQGKVVLITFWASNCASCIKEIPDFKRLYQDYHKSGLEIIAIAMYYDRPNYVLDARGAYALPYDIVLDLDMHLANAFGHVSFTPTTFLLNLQGEIIYQTTGLLDISEVQKRIEQQLQARI